MSDDAGNWPKWIENAVSKVKETVKKTVKTVKKFVKNTFGIGVIKSQSYESIKADTIVYGYEQGTSTSKVISGDISKPVSFYLETGSKWWEATENKIGVQFNVDNSGISYSTNSLETNVTIAVGDNSLDIILGYNKIGYTANFGVSFANRTAQLYQHEYIRTIPTAVAVAGVAVASYYTGGAVAYLITIFGGSGRVVT